MSDERKQQQPDEPPDADSAADDRAHERDDEPTIADDHTAQAIGEVGPGGERVDG